MRRVATSWKLIEEVLWEHAHRAYDALRPPASRGDITELEDVLGRRVPDGLKASLRVHDGMRDRQDVVDYRALIPCKGIASWWRLCTRSQRQDGFDGNQFTKTRRIKNDVRWRDGWIPILETVGGNLTVLYLDPGLTGTRGQIFPWYNNGATAMRVVADSFPAWLDALAEELVCRRFTLDDMGTVNLKHQLT